MDKQQFETLVYWMHERQRIYLARRGGKPWPWTRDPVLQHYKFCNVYREQDRTTVWIRENWREPWRWHRNLAFSMAMARQINWPPTLQAIGFPHTWNPQRVLRIMRGRKAKGYQLYSGAYMLTAGGGARGMEKAVITVEMILDPLYKAMRKQHLPWMDAGCTLERAAKWLHPFHGFGPFLGYEVATDLRHTRYLCAAPDIQTWAGSGPGARRGLNRIFSRPLNFQLKEPQIVAEIQELLALIRQTAQTREQQRVLPHLEMRDVEHSLCEYDKYCRAGEGRRGLDLFRPSVKKLF